MHTCTNVHACMHAEAHTGKKGRGEKERREHTSSRFCKTTWLPSLANLEPVASSAEKPLGNILSCNLKLSSLTFEPFICLFLLYVRLKGSSGVPSFSFFADSSPNILELLSPGGSLFLSSAFSGRIRSPLHAKLSVTSQESQHTAPSESIFLLLNNPHNEPSFEKI